LASYLHRDEEPIATLSRRAASLIIFSSVAIFLIPSYIAGGLGPHEDELIQYYPCLSWLGACLRSGIFPLWNPHAYGGYPFFADPQTGVFYPPNFIFAILPARLAYPALISFAYLVAGFGMYRLARSWRLARISAVLGALAWMYCGFFTGHRTHLTMIAGTAWLSVILWLWTRTIDGRVSRHFVLVILAQALQIFAGHFQIVIFTMLISLPYVLIYSSRRRLRYLALWAAAWALSFGLGAVQLVGGFELLAMSVRQAGGVQFLTENSFFPMAWPILIAPAVMGLRVSNAIYTYPYFGPWHHCEMNLFAGIVVLILSVSVFLRRQATFRQTRIVIFLSILAGVGLFFALGRYNPIPVYRWLAHVPVFRSFRSPARHLMWFNFAIAALAMFGVERLRVRNAIAQIRRLALAGIASVVVTAFIVFLLLCKFLAEKRTDAISATLPSDYKHILAATSDAVRVSNPAIFIPLLIALLLIALVLWMPARRLPFALVGLALAEFATIVPCYDVFIPPRDVLAQPPAVSLALDRIEADRNNHLVLPLGRDPYRDPLSYLHPFCNLLYDRPTLTGYGPFLNKYQRSLFGFELWPTTCRYLDLVSRPDLLARMGVTYIIAEPPLARQIDQLIDQKPSPTERAAPVSVNPESPGTINLPVKPGLYRMQFSIQRMNGDEFAFGLNVEGVTDPIWQDQCLLLRRWDVDEHWRSVFWTFYVPPGHNDELRLAIKNGRGRASLKDMTLRRVPLLLDWLEPVWRSEAGGAMYRNRNSRGRIYFAQSVDWTKTADEAIDRLLADKSLGKTCLTAEMSESVPSGGQGQVVRTQWDTNTLEADVEVTGGPAVLVICDSFYPGWRATVDGKVTKVFRADGLNKAIAVDPGRHRIVLTFLPDTFLLGTVMSAGSALALAIFAASGKLRALLLSA